MNASRRDVINGVIDKFKNSIEGYKVISDANENDEVTLKIKVLSSWTEVIYGTNTYYQYDISSDGKSLLYNGVNIKNMKLINSSDGELIEIVVKDHLYGSYAKDKIVVEHKSLQIEDEFCTASTTTILIKDVAIPSFSTLPMRNSFTPKCFALEFHITSKDDANGADADEVIDYLEQIIYSDFKRIVEIELDDNGALKKTHVQLHGKLDYYDSIESRLNDIQKRVATAKFFFFVKY